MLRDAASRGLRALLIERNDFASGTSSRSSKMVHGGLRYLAHGHLAITREACRERDLLLRHEPESREAAAVPVLRLRERQDARLAGARGAQRAYWGLANFRRSARFRMLSRRRGDAVLARLPPGRLARGRALPRRAGGRRAPRRRDLKSARRLGAEAANHAEVVEFLRDSDGQLGGARVRDALDGRTLRIRAGAVVNAAGPSIERVRGLDQPASQRELRPAKGVHIVIPRERIHAEGAVAVESPARRALACSCARSTTCDDRHHRRPSRTRSTSRS